MHIRIALQRLREDLQRCNYSTNTLDSSLLDLQMCFADSERSLAKITFRDVELFFDTPITQDSCPRRSAGDCTRDNIF